jgi:hypothetical protein|tara:strand:- start:1923 stop:2126 length:204 start_codon:yes stop_codon:yes gene_type:complete
VIKLARKIIDNSEDELNALYAKHRVLDMQIDELWKSYVSETILKKLKYKKAKLKLKIESLKNKKNKK